MNSFDNLLTNNCPLLFIDNNPRPESAQEQQHHFFAGNRNKFFRLFNQSGMLDEHVQSDQESFDLYGIGFSYFVQQPTKSEKDMTSEVKNIGKQQLKKKIEVYKPKLICFLGKKCCQYFLYKRRVEFGLVDYYDAIPIYCLPHPSSWGSTISYDTKLEHWKKFAVYLNEIGHGIKKRRYTTLKN